MTALLVRAADSMDAIAIVSTKLGKDVLDVAFDSLL
jgi:hypothetical protein